jgi:biopolymer transport protein ExbD
MGIQIETGGRRRDMKADLNLVPFIDLLTVCIAFLMVTAVWSQVHTMQVDQAVGDPEARIPESTVPPLTVHLRRDGLWVGRDPEAGRNRPSLDASLDWAGFAEDLSADRQAWPEQREVVIVTDDDVAYEAMIRALDLARGHGYDDVRLGSGPALRIGG